MGMYKDLTGKKYYMLTVIGRNGSNRYGSVWECRCDCGNTIYVNANMLNSGGKRSCGCQIVYKKNYDLTGQRFGRFIVLGEAERKYVGNGGNIRMLRCKCDCGNIVIKRRSAVIKGDTRSCGCLNRDISYARARHHMTNTRIHHCWSSMLARCGKHKDYLNVSVCEGWKVFENFYKWSMENGYQDDLSIDRIDPYGNYEPSNCRWTSMKVQQNNKRNNRYFTIDGVTHTMSEWADIYNVPYRLVKGRIRIGWNIVDALTNKRYATKKTKVIETGVVYPSRRECANALGIDETGIWRCTSGRKESYKGYHFEIVEE